MVYQGFSLLTANREVLASLTLTEIASRHDRSVAQVAFSFALTVGMIPLSGTTNANHMLADLDVFSFQLEREEVELIDRSAMA